METRSVLYLLVPSNLLKLPARHLIRIMAVLFVYSFAVGCVSRLELAYSDVENRRLTEQIMALATEVDENADFLTLSAKIKALIDVRIKKNWSRRKKLNALRELLYDKDGYNIRYSADTTKTATETFNTGSGNCLSLASLFIGAARHLDLDAHFKVVEVSPTWDYTGRTMIRYEHIIAAGRLSPGEHYVVDFLPEFVVGERDATLIGDRRALALFYNNLGAENIVDGNHQEAVSYLVRALHIYPDFSDAWNNMGAALRRSGKGELAEFSFRKSIALNQSNYSALSNLARYYRKSGEPQKADPFLKRVNIYRVRNPYFHFFLSRLYFKEGNFAQSRQFLEASIKLKRSEPDFYLAMAEINEALGEDKLRKKNMRLFNMYQKERREPRRTRLHGDWYIIEVN